MFLLVFSLLISQILTLHCIPRSTTLEAGNQTIVPQGRTIFQETFENLDNWHREGFVEGVTIFKPGIMRLDCSGSQQGGVGCMAFCKQDFPDSICIEFDFYMEEKNGLVLVFCGMKGLNSEDAITGLPPRKGLFDEYTGADALIRSYHVSISRYYDRGVHTGVSNWRRNPGLHLMSQGTDRCKQIRTKYHIAIIKAGPTCQLWVNGKIAHGFTDPQTLPGEIPTSGKVGFRAIGSKAIARISNFKITALR